MADKEGKEKIEQRVRTWIEEHLGGKLADNKSLFECLRSGVALCKLISKFKPGSIKTIYTTSVSVAYKENANNYLKVCASLGLAKEDIFALPDLLEGKNFAAVLRNIYALGKAVEKESNFVGPALGDPPAPIPEVYVEQIRPAAPSSTVSSPLLSRAASSPVPSTSAPSAPTTAESAEPSNGTAAALLASSSSAASFSQAVPSSPSTLPSNSVFLVAVPSAAASSSGLTGTSGFGSSANAEQKRDLTEDPSTIESDSDEFDSDEVDSDDSDAEEKRAPTQLLPKRKVPTTPVPLPPMRKLQSTPTLSATDATISSAFKPSSSPSSSPQAPSPLGATADTSPSTSPSGISQLAMVGDASSSVTDEQTKRELEQLRSKVKFLEQEVNKLQASNFDSRADMVKLKSHNDNLKSKQAKQSIKSASLKAKLQDAQKIAEEAQRDNERIREEILSAAERKVEQLKLEELLSDFQDLKAEENRALLQAIKRENAALMETIEKFNSLKTQTITEAPVVAVIPEGASPEEMIAKLQQENTELRAHAQQLDKVNASLQELVTSVFEEKQLLTDELSQIQSRMEELVKDRDTLVEKIEKLTLRSKQTPAQDGEPKAATPRSKLEKFFGEKVDPKKKEQKEQTIPEEEGMLFASYKGNIEIRGGTVTKLIEKLYALSFVGEIFEYVGTFLLTYRSFTNSREVLDMLIQTYQTCIPKSTSGDEDMEQKKMRLKIISFLRRWVESFFHDFEGDTELLENFNRFVDTILQSGFDQNLANILKRAVERQIEQLHRGEGHTEFLFDTPAPIPLLPKNLKELSFETVDSLELARQITLIHSKLYRSIPPKECLNKNWTEKDKEVRAPNMIKYIKSFNQLSNWVTWTVVSEPNIRKRHMYIKKFIDVIKSCRKLNDFSGYFAILAGLQASPVNRMKRTWELVHAQKQKAWEEITTTANSTQSYKTYRGALHNADPPCVPYLGVYLTDLVFIEDGNPTYLENGYVNFFKRRLIADVIRELQQYQQVPYNLTPVDIVQNMFLSHQILDDNDLFKTSQTNEPKNIPPT